MTWSLLTLRVRCPTCTLVGRGVGLRARRGFLGERERERAAPPPRGERSLCDRVLSERSLDVRALGDLALGDRALGERALGERALGERALGERALGERALGDRALGERALGERPRAFCSPDAWFFCALPFDLKEKF